MFNNKTILITGGTGSFGNKTLVSLLNQDFKEIRIFSRDELKQHLMRQEFTDQRISFAIGDIRDKDSILKHMQGVDYVFHAAALKQVPTCDLFPIEAIKTNVLGAYNVIEAAIEHKVKRIICLSTDKAVFPINAMGMSKALMEKIAFARARTLKNKDTIIGCVRYGNVMYSRGSVIPLFIEQIKQNKPITITDKNMTRFMMSLDEAVGLVLFAINNAKQGDLFVRKSPACTVEVLANAIKKIFNSDSLIETIGIRHGEKIFETLVTAEEMSRSDNMQDYYRISIDHENINYGYEYNVDGSGRMSNIEDYTSTNTTVLSLDETVDLLLTLPEIRKEMNK